MSFYMAEKVGQDLSGKRLPQNCNWATLRGANLSGADLSNSKFRWANLTGADVTGANLSGTVLELEPIADNSNRLFPKFNVLPITIGDACALATLKGCSVKYDTTESCREAGKPEQGEAGRIDPCGCCAVHYINKDGYKSCDFQDYLCSNHDE